MQRKCEQAAREGCDKGGGGERERERGEREVAAVDTIQSAVHQLTIYLRTKSSSEYEMRCPACQLTI